LGAHADFQESQHARIARGFSNLAGRIVNVLDALPTAALAEHANPRRLGKTLATFFFWVAASAEIENALLQTKQTKKARKNIAQFLIFSSHTIYTCVIIHIRV
jgi:hypothetical protein